MAYHQQHSCLSNRSGHDHTDNSGTKDNSKSYCYVQPDHPSCFVQPKSSDNSSGDQKQKFLTQDHEYVCFDFLSQADKKQRHLSGPEQSLTVWAHAVSLNYWMQ